AGMVIKPEIVERALSDDVFQKKATFNIFFSPQGKHLTQDLLKELVEKARGKEVILLPARYEGMDARIEEEYADEIVSLGNFVLMGGDVPAMALLEGLLRLIPGVVGKTESVEEESFSG